MLEFAKLMKEVSLHASSCCLPAIKTLHLRSCQAILKGTRAQALHCNAHHRLKAWSHLQEFPKNQCTANLHWLVCRVHRQEVARGGLAKDGEWWGEHLVRRLKKKISK